MMQRQSASSELGVSNKVYTRNCGPTEANKNCPVSRAAQWYINQGISEYTFFSQALCRNKKDSQIHPSYTKLLALFCLEYRAVSWHRLDLRSRSSGGLKYILRTFCLPLKKAGNRSPPNGLIT